MIEIPRFGKMKEFTFYIEEIPPQFRSMEVISTQACILRIDAFFVGLATNNFLTYYHEVSIVNECYRKYSFKLSKGDQKRSSHKTILFESVRTRSKVEWMSGIELGNGT